MHSKSNNIEIMTYDKADEAIEELFESRLSRYQIELKTSMKVGNLIFVCAHLFYYKCHKINLNPGGSCIDSHECIKDKKQQ